ncbi:hypothetical protein DNI29_19000 [Hymenobacter sediminis]|uniref:hypothetical protein n=1 Tax=Hymenobacter sediminis TaxID=2218621 RepID=UPI000F4ED245|nr:hypothetical protein [Hymenobacter sediminis]RPD45470.1 hypothetical protein DNI29_19000 [Hymenobacter sediminis]
MEHILEKIPGETRSEEKTRFKAALNEVVPFMDRFYSGSTLRRFPNRSASHVRNIKQWGVVDWDVLKYWREEYLPQPVEAAA